MKLWLLLLIASLVPTGLAAATVAEETAAATMRLETQDCASYALRPFGEVRSAIGGHVVAHVSTEGLPSTARLCLIDAWGVKRADVTVAFGAGEDRNVEIPAPPGVYTIRLESGGFTGTAGMSTRWCSSRAADTDVTLWRSDRGYGGSIRGGTCVGNTVALGGLGILGSLLAAALGKFPHLGAALLYSRLAKPRVLDHDVRARMLALIAREPGIHSRELARALGVGDGQVAYHLGVLVREKQLVSVGLPGMRHWFVAGRCPPSRARALAALRDPTRRRLYEAVVATPGATVTDLAGRARVSVGQGSRAASALERVGLVERRRVGKSVHLVPRPEWETM